MLRQQLVELRVGQAGLVEGEEAEGLELRSDVKAIIDAQAVRDVLLTLTYLQLQLMLQSLQLNMPHRKCYNAEIMR